MEPSRTDEQTQRFVKAIRTALVGPPGYSQRELSAAIGVTCGSLSKYLRSEVAPGKVGFDVQVKLAAALGHSIESLNHYYETGEWESELTLEDVTGWLQSSAGAEDLPAVMQSLTIASTRIAGVDASAAPEKPKPYTWPMTALQEAGLTDALRERMGLGNDRLKALAKDGEFDDELVEAFSVATNLDEAAVREAFEKREAVI